MSSFHFESQPSAKSEGHLVEVPTNLHDKTELLAFLARAIPLPDYFGHNGDALEECLVELTEPDRPKITLFHHDVPLEDEPDDQQTYLEILNAVARDSDRLVVIFPEEDREQVSGLLE
jgi:hypothetical protein